MTHKYHITGMTCSGCVAKVKSELLKLNDVTAAEVQLQYPQAVITMQQHISLAQLQQALNKAGKYIITEDNGADLDHSSVIGNDNMNEGNNSYFPIFLIFSYITGITLFIQLAKDTFDVMQWLSHFMAGFFLVFSFFKLMNLKGFAEGYSTYDIIARRIPLYGFLYPFIELALGIAFLIGWEPLLVNIVTLLVMAVSSIGVAQSLMRKTRFQCACLGTVIKLPLSRVTLFEDILMVVMSIVMIANL